MINKKKGDALTLYLECMPAELRALFKTLSIWVEAVPGDTKQTLEEKRFRLAMVAREGFKLESIRLEIMLSPPPPGYPQLPEVAKIHGIGLDNEICRISLNFMGGSWYQGWFLRYPKHTPLTLTGIGSAKKARNARSAVTELSRITAHYLGFAQKGSPQLHLDIDLPKQTSELHLARCAKDLNRLAHRMGKGRQACSHHPGSVESLFTVETLGAWYVR